MTEMIFQLGSSERWFYGGVVLMAASMVMGIMFLFIFGMSSRKLKKLLEEEYGKIEK